MLRFVLTRLLWSIPVLLGIILTTFLISRAIPGGPFDSAGDRSLPEVVVRNLNAKYHLDWPLWKQFVSYLIGDELLSSEGTSKGLIRGDLGLSYRLRGTTVVEIVAAALPVSMQLGILALVLAVVVGLPLGVVAASYHNTGLDHVLTFFAVLGTSVPALILAPFLVWIFALTLHWFPAALWGATPPFVLWLLPRPTATFVSHAVLPAAALAIPLLAGIARITRGSLLQTIRTDYVRTAYAKGLRRRTAIIRHALPNALIPVVTVLGPMLAWLLGGTFVIEKIFGIPGLGQRFVESVGNADYTVSTGITLIYSSLIVASNLLVDITYGFLDPRIVYT